MTNQTRMLPHVAPDLDSMTRWFSAQGCVMFVGHRCDVWVGGTLIATFERADAVARNVALLGLEADANVNLGKLAWAFDVTYETLRRVRQVKDAGGLAAVVARLSRGRPISVTATTQAKIEAMLDGGASIDEIVTKLGKRGGFSRSTVGRARVQWAAKRAEAATEVAPVVPPEPQLLLAAAETVEESVVVDGDSVVTAAVEAPAAFAAIEEFAPLDTSVPEQAAEPSRAIVVEPHAERGVQHLGTWIFMAVAALHGLHSIAEKEAKRRVEGPTLRVALDATLAALAIGERCVEGVRRIDTPTGDSLLRTTHVPSASWVRRTLGRLSDDTGGAHLHLGVAGSYLRALRDQVSGEPLVFYVDNHLRPYTGKHTLRRGWRMQDKRVLPGCSDYYVHDEDGRPLLRIVAPDHSPLTSMLLHIAGLLRTALGPEQRIVLAFDRAGAFPEQLVALRDADVDFVTYERRPYPLLVATAFADEILVGGERVGVCDSRTNLGAGRGRVRRIALRMPGGRQINLLAASMQPAEWLARVMRGRWCQENGFKHGVERWGINQLDGRSVSHYPPDTVVPNPARRRLDHALRIVRTREGDARNNLARLPADDPKRKRYQDELDEAFARRAELEAQRPGIPTHAPVRDTELADRLVLHKPNYKLTLDTIRVVCANVESDLAGELAPHMAKPAEAKRLLRNLFLAPGSIRVGSRTITVNLEPAATRHEMAAIAALLRTVTAWNLTLPGDAKRRRLRFQAQLQ